MRLFIAFFVSIIIHIVFIIFVLNLEEKIDTTPDYLKRLSVIVVSINNEKSKDEQLVVDSSAKDNPSPVKDKISIPLNSNVVKNIVPADVGEINSVEFSENYYASKDLDIKAIPITNIDGAKLSQNLYSGIPIELRLYINALGRVVKIERIHLASQDDTFTRELEGLLYKLSFTPAKKGGVDVSSFQDISFSFK